MDFEQALETQRHRLLRLVAGLLVVVGILGLGPVSRRFSQWSLGYVASILSRAEAAAKYLVIAQARLMVSRNGMQIDEGRILDRLAQISVEDDADMSLPQCQRRLRRLRAVLRDIPHHAARLLRRIARQMRRAFGTRRGSPRPEQHLSVPVDAGHLPTDRIERPPDKILAACLFQTPPLGIPAGGASG